MRPFPVLQILNILFGLLGLAWEWPLPLFIAGSAFHRSIGARLAIYPLSVFVAVLLYQGTNAAIYYMVGIAVYCWAYSEGEVSQALHCARREDTDTAAVDCMHAVESTRTSPRSHESIALQRCLFLSAITAVRLVQRN